MTWECQQRIEFLVERNVRLSVRLGHAAFALHRALEHDSAHWKHCTEDVCRKVQDVLIENERTSPQRLRRVG